MKSFPFTTLCWVNKAQQIFQAQRTMYFPQFLETDLLSQTIVSQVQMTFICSAMITVE